MVTVVTVTTVSLLKNDAVTENQLTADNPTQINVSDSISADNTDIYLVENESATQNTNQSNSPAEKPDDTEKTADINSSNPANTAEPTPTPSNTITTHPTTATTPVTNHQCVQHGNSKDMLFSIDDIICHVSKFMTLKIGDIIFTGTPEGVGKVAINDRLQGFIGEEKFLDFKIK